MSASADRPGRDFCDSKSWKGEKAAEDSRGQSPLTWWNQNWRKGGLQDRRNQIIKEMDFYNQQYCGCEYSMRNMKEKI
ncbi:MAG: epoxyqueuosine reductase QueH [Bacteroidia bacterium]|nr:epoxyqueuosine reductase QueH [Bacteroidia bacterium]